jgi:hypothetical protein
MDASPDSNRKTSTTSASLESGSNSRLDAFHNESQKLEQGAKRKAAALYKEGAFVLGTEIEPKLEKAGKELKEALSGGAFVSAVEILNRGYDATVAFAKRELGKSDQPGAAEILTANLHNSCNDPRGAFNALAHEVNSLDPGELHQAVVEMNMQAALTNKAYFADFESLFKDPEVVFLQDCAPRSGQELDIPYKRPAPPAADHPTASLNIGNFSINFFN